jgi:hypothetical protein
MIFGCTPFGQAPDHEKNEDEHDPGNSDNTKRNIADMPVCLRVQDVESQYSDQERYE